MMEFPSLDPDSDGIPQLATSCQCRVQPKSQRKSLETRWLQAKGSELERSQKESTTTALENSTTTVQIGLPDSLFVSNSLGLW